MRINPWQGDPEPKGDPKSKYQNPNFVQILKAGIRDPTPGRPSIRAVYRRWQDRDPEQTVNKPETLLKLHLQGGSSIEQTVNKHWPEHERPE